MTKGDHFPDFGKRVLGEWFECKNEFERRLPYPFAANTNTCTKLIMVLANPVQNA
jgi:hypothetical protein